MSDNLPTIGDLRRQGMSTLCARRGDWARLVVKRLQRFAFMKLQVLPGKPPACGHRYYDQVPKVMQHHFDDEFNRMHIVSVETDS